MSESHPQEKPIKLTRPQIKTLYHFFGAIEATHPGATVELIDAGTCTAALIESPTGYTLSLLIDDRGRILV